VTNLKTIIELITFCGVAVSIQDVFLFDLSCEETNCLMNLALSSEGFGSFLAFFDGLLSFFQQFNWLFLAFF